MKSSLMPAARLAACLALCFGFAAFAGKAGAQQVPLPKTAAEAPGPAVAAEDRQQILDLISRYSYAFDGKDIDSFLALFTKDCLWEAYVDRGQKEDIKVTSREELRAAITKRLVMVQHKGVQSRHCQTNTVLTARADGRVEGVTMLNLVWQERGERPRTVTTGTYRDLFVKTEGGWKFAKRSFYADEPAI